jgi:surface antigen
MGKGIIGGALALSLVLAGCQTAGPKQTVGTIAGGVAGGLVGSQIGSGSGKLVAVGAGTLIGAFLGGQIGASLDETDRLYAEQTYYNALESQPTGYTSSWRNPNSGNYGTVTPTRTYVRGGTDCRDYEQTIYVQGRPQTGVGTACRNPDGTWSIVN